MYKYLFNTRRLPRSSGLLLHPTSLPSDCGIGDIGKVSIEFLDYLVDTGQQWWQMLPIGPCGAGNSPYQSPSSFAGNPLLIELDQLVDWGLLERPDVSSTPGFPVDHVDFGHVRAFKESMLRRAFSRFGDGDEAFARFRARNQSWLPDHALFESLRSSFAGTPWPEWPAALATRDPSALRAAHQQNAAEVAYYEFVQYIFECQWDKLRHASKDRGLLLMGDVPIFVSHESAEVWSRPELFQLDVAGRPTHVAGVPPDYFCKQGQLWGNPLYDWERHADEGFAWWRARLKAQLDRFDLIRLDHFRGFEAYWRIPAAAVTAEAGEWAAGPRDAFFRAIDSEFQGLPFVAEDLGEITPEVLALRDRIGLPGMKVLQFAFDAGPANPYLPSHYPNHCVVYTGTHDNDTTAGWYHTLPGWANANPEHCSDQRAFIAKYLGREPSCIHWDLIALALASAADLAIIPLQDVLGLGSEARMNRPGTAEGNWGWRVLREQLEDRSAKQRFADLSWTYDRKGSQST